MSVGSSRKLNVVMLGACRAVAARLSQIQQQRDVQVSWIVDRDGEAGRKLASKVPGKPEVITPTYTSLALADPSVDAVFVCAPNTKVNTVRKAIQNGKGVFCVRPFFRDVGGLLTCHEEAHTAGTLFSCFLPRRTDSMAFQLKQRLTEDNIGSVESIHMSASYGPLPSEDVQRLSAGLLHECAVNELGLACSLIGEDPVTVFSESIPSKHGLVNTVGNAAIMLHFPGGAIATADVRKNQLPEGYRVEVYGSDGEVTLECCEKGTSMTSVTSHGSRTLVEGISHSKVQANSLKTAINQFIDTMKVGISEEQVAQEMMENLRVSFVATACQEAAKTKRVVNLSLDFLHNPDYLERPIWKERPDAAGADPGF